MLAAWKRDAPRQHLGRYCTVNGTLGILLEWTRGLDYAPGKDKYQLMQYIYGISVTSDAIILLCGLIWSLRICWTSHKVHFINRLINYSWSQVVDGFSYDSMSRTNENCTKIIEECQARKRGEQLPLKTQTAFLLPNKFIWQYFLTSFATHNVPSECHKLGCKPKYFLLASLATLFSTSFLKHWHCDG